MFRKALATMVVLACLVTTAQAQKSALTRGQKSGKSQDETSDISKQRLATAVQQALENRPEGKSDLIEPVSSGVYLLDIQLNKKRKEIVLNFTQQLLNYGPNSDLELVLQHILSYVEDVDLGWSETNYKILVDGTPLTDILEPLDKEMIAAAKAPDKNLELTENRASGTLSGKRIVISPGHGWYWKEGLRSWQLQRSYFYGIVEDFVNAEMVMSLNSALGSTGADIRSTRNLNKNAGSGDTGHAKWEESAKYHVKAQGAPSSVYDSGSNDYDKDITSRPLYANYVNGNILVSLHNNGGKGKGSETWYDSANGQQSESKKLATILHNKVVSAIRQQYNSNWSDRGVKSCNGCYGENRLATRPAVLLEVAFMDTKTPDNDALHDEVFKKLVATAIKQGIEEYYGVAGTFSLSASPFTQTIKQGSKVSFTVSVKSIDGFKSKVSMSAKNLPGNRVITGTVWQPPSVTPSSNGTAYSTFILATDKKTPVGTFYIDLEGKSGEVTKKTTVQLIIKRN